MIILFELKKKQFTLFMLKNGLDSFHYELAKKVGLTIT